jgi:3-oxoacyl-[acyl-carrier-protein] synthase II
LMERHKVAITGIGLINPLGNTTAIAWDKAISGQSGITRTDDPRLRGYPYKDFGFVRDEQAQLDRILDLPTQRKTSRFIQLGVIAADEALRDAGFSSDIPRRRDRFGVFFGVGIGGLDSIREGADALAQKGPKKVSPLLTSKSIINQAAAQLSMEWNIQGPNSSFVSACSSSGDSVGHAFRMIRDGYADYMLTGGSESCVVPLAIASFGNMRALCRANGDDPTKASRPFDKKRAGFVMSEGAAVLVLERMDLARKRNAEIYAEATGYGSTSDAYHYTAMHPTGRGAVKAMQLALADAGLAPAQIGYINAHGTSTQMNDKIETDAIKTVFGRHVAADNPQRAIVSSTKSMTGHLIGVAGGTEISYSALALKQGIFPPTINLDHPDPECDLDYIPHTAREADIEYAMSNSFGFGGGNAIVVLKKV